MKWEIAKICFSIAIVTNIVAWGVCLFVIGMAAFLSRDVRLFTEVGWFFVARVCLLFSAFVTIIALYSMLKED